MRNVCLIKEYIWEQRKLRSQPAVMEMINMAHLRCARFRLRSAMRYGLRATSYAATCPSLRTSFTLPLREFIRFHPISTFYLYYVFNATILSLTYRNVYKSYETLIIINLMFWYRTWFINTIMSIPTIIIILNIKFNIKIARKYYKST